MEKPAWEIAFDTLNLLVSKGSISKPISVQDNNMKFYNCDLGQFALETPRAKRQVKGAKFWFSFPPKAFPEISVEKKEIGGGRNNKLNTTPGSRLGKDYPCWHILVSDSIKSKEEVIVKIVNSLSSKSESQLASKDDVEFPTRAGELAPDEKMLREIWARRGQPRFRNVLLEAYGNRCCISDSSIVELLEAAHIDSHSDGGDYSVSNGLLLRADFHTLFDQLLLSVDEHLVIHLANSLKNSEYKKCHGRKIQVPK